jgi:hypothetical protein
MKSLHNIEKLPGRTDYTGYAAGRVWRIRKTSRWHAWTPHGDSLSADTLSALSVELDAFDRANLYNQSHRDAVATTGA